MLVLSRKQNQEIVIGDNIKITVLKIKGNTIRLGIDAPRDVKVVRGELPALKESELAAPHESDSTAPSEENEANVTIVFCNHGDEEPVRPNVIPFEPKHRTQKKAPANRGSSFFHRVDANPLQSNPLQSNGAESSHDLSDAPTMTVRFREPLPQSFRHNRLKELVKQLTQDQSSQ